MTTGKIFEKEIEVHKTEYIDKELPTIYFKEMDVKSMTEYKLNVIQVSDKTSEDAYEVFKKIKENSDE